MIDFTNSLAESWWSWMAPLSLQVALLAGIVLAADIVLKKRGWAQVRYAMWLVVFAKLLLPPTLHLSTSVTAGLFRQPAPRATATLTNEPTIAPAPPVTAAWEPALSEGVAADTPAMTAAAPAEAFEAPAVAATGVISIAVEREKLTLHAWGMLVWGLMALGLLIVMTAKAVGLMRMLKGAEPPGEDLTSALERAAGALSLRQRVSVVVARGFPGVAVFGIFRPTIVLPADSLEGFTAQELEHILLHELAHVKRRDLWVNAAQGLLQIAFWFHPLVWLAGRRLRALRELCCDASVAGLLRESTPSYRATLAGVARRMMADRAQFTLGLLGLFEGKSRLRERLEHLTRSPWRRRRLRIVIALAAVMALAVFVVPMAPGKAEVDEDVIKFKKLEMFDTRAAATWQVSTKTPSHFVAGFYSVKDDRPDGWGSTIINPDNPSGQFVLEFSWRRDKATVGMRFSTVAGTTDDWGALKKLVSSLDTDAMFEMSLPEGDLSMEPLAQKPAPLSSNEYVNIMRIGTKTNGVETSVIYLAIKPVMHGKGDNSFDAEKAYAALSQGPAAGRVAPDINAKAAELVPNSSTRSDVLRVFGEPTEYLWGNKTFTKNNLPDRYIMRYPEGFSVVMFEDVVGEVRHSAPSQYLFLGRISIGSSPEEVFAVLGKPQDTVEGRPLPRPREQGVFYKDISGRQGHCYYDRSRENGVRFFFVNNKVGHIYVTGTPTVVAAADEPPAGRVDADINTKADQLVVNSSTRSDVIRLFGAPTKYVWGNNTFTKGNLPDRYIMLYSEGFSVVMFEDVVGEVRHVAPSRYLFLDRISMGSSPEEVFAVVGKPQNTVEGKPVPRLAEQGVFYKDINGKRGYCYYDSSRENGVRFFFSNSRVSAIYVTGTPTAASTTSASDDTPPPEDRKPQPISIIEGLKRHPLRIRMNVTSIPKYDPDSRSPFQVDLRGADLDRLDLANSAEDLAYATFDSNTAWPDGEKMSADFDPETILELGKNPGLGTRGLHVRGITGRGVGIAVIDQTLLVEHSEYADRLRLYEEINIHRGASVSMHGPATASIAAGKTVGVAPEADLYHIALWPIDANKKSSYENIDFRYHARAIRRVLEINRGLPENEKIRAISFSIGWQPSHAGYEEMTAAVDEAKEAGILVTSSSMEQTYGFRIHGLERKPMADPDVFESYEPGLFWAREFGYGGADGRLLIPMDSRTTAGPTGAGDYAFYRQGGWSWITPYLAGVYALACQVKPDITPEEFLSLAMETGRTIEFTQDGKSAPLGPIIDPVALIGKLEERAGTRGGSP